MPAIASIRRSLSVARRKEQFTVDFLRYGRRYTYPTIYIACPPKTGSTWLSNLLAELMPGYRYYYPTTHARSSGRGNFDVTEQVLSELRGKLAIVRSHTPPTPNNTELMDAKLDKYVVLLRDMRDVIVSAYHHVMRYGESSFLDYGLERVLPWNTVSQDVLKLDAESGLDMFIETVLPGLVDMAQGWYDYQRDHDNVLLVRYEDMVQDVRSEISKVLDFYNVSVPDEFIEFALNKTASEKDKMKFRKGVAGGWENELTEQQKARCEEIAGSLHISMGYS